MPVVYMAINTANGKRYIGATKFTLEKRKIAHLYAASRSARTCRKFYGALRKHGSDSFSWMALAEFECVTEAFEAEKRLISELKPEYNLSSGGEHGSVGVKRTKEYCLNLSRIHKGKVLCLDDNIVYPSVGCAALAYGIHEANLTGLLRGYKNFSSSRKGKHFIYYNGPLTEQQRTTLIAEKDNAAVERRKRGRKPYKPLVCGGKDTVGRSRIGLRPVLCVTTAKTFQSISEAARHYDICKSAIAELCAGRKNRKTAGGLVFRYVDKAA